MAQGNNDRLMELLTKAMTGELTADEETELKSLGEPVQMATDQQKSYIFDLLEKISADLSDFTGTDWPDLTLEEASELIDTIKEEVTEEKAWDEG